VEVSDAVHELVAAVGVGVGSRAAEPCHSYVETEVTADFAESAELGTKDWPSFGEVNEVSVALGSRDLAPCIRLPVLAARLQQVQEIADGSD
jgi:hypothetical protein